MAISSIKAIIKCDTQKFGKRFLAVENANGCSDLSKTVVINERQFIEYTKKGYPTTFTITSIELYKRWEFDMDNSNMKGHWIGIFTSKGEETEIEFTEHVTAKKFYLKPFVKFYLKNHQKQYMEDLKKALLQI